MLNNSFKQNVMAALAALILTSTAVGAAVGPARAIETAPVAYAQVEVDRANV